MTHQNLKINDRVKINSPMNGLVHNQEGHIVANEVETTGYYLIKLDNLPWNRNYIPEEVVKIEPVEQLMVNIQGYVCNESNKWGMLGRFYALKLSHSSYYTIFFIDITQPPVFICRHENIEQAQEMADEMNSMSAKM